MPFRVTNLWLFSAGRIWLATAALAGLLAGQQAPAGAQHPQAAPGAAPSANMPGAPAAAAGQPDAATDLETLFPHSEPARYWVSGQANIILQGHGVFPARYSGPNSLTNWAQSATTHVLTLYTGYQLTRTTEVFADFEDATGNGIGNANGLAGYSNLDSVRLVQGMPLSKSPYLARLMLRQIVPLTDARVDEDRDELHLAASVPARRLEFRLGKFDLADFLDVNSWGSDSHLQFMNWTVDNNGAWDYAANTRGYTDGALVEFDDRGYAVRFAEALMPKIANGINLDADLARSRAENLELEAAGNRIGGKPGAIRLLGYWNTADMGSYRQAVDEFLSGKAVTPNIIATRQQGRHRYGFGLNFEQAITKEAGVFGRLGWSDGHTESFCYTEDDRTAEAGMFSMGRRWRRPTDRAGAAFVANGIVPAHQQYLALGGLGFLLGDGALTYGHEKIFEGFYTAHLWRGFFASYDFQHFNDPGYNQARGPVSVESVRGHVDF